MHNANIPSDREIPSTAKLIKSTFLAVIVAGVLLVSVVMPSEYGIDPTGLGEATGLKRMGEIKISLAEEASSDAASDVVIDAAIDADTEALKNTRNIIEAENTPTSPQVIAENIITQSHEKTFTLAPDEGHEVKVTMIKGAKVDYVWETNGGKVNFDVHGDSKKLKIKYHPYYKGSDVKREGSLEAVFDGGHGWFWRNRTKEPLMITIKTNGEYTEIKQY